MFDNLTERLTQSLRNISGSGTLNEDNIKDTLREVRMALLEADVEPSPLFRGEVTNSPSFIGSSLITVGFGVSDGEKNTGLGVKRVVRFPLEHPRRVPVLE